MAKEERITVLRVPVDTRQTLLQNCMRYKRALFLVCHQKPPENGSEMPVGAIHSVQCEIPGSH